MEALKRGGHRGVGGLICCSNGWFHSKLGLNLNLNLGLGLGPRLRWWLSRIGTLILFWLHVYGLELFGDVRRGGCGSGDDRRLSRRHVHSLPSVVFRLCVYGLPLIRGFGIGIVISIGISIAIGSRTSDAIRIRIGGVIRIADRVVDNRSSIRTLFRMSKSHVKILLIFLIENLRASTHATSVFAFPTWILPRRSHLF